MSSRVRASVMGVLCLAAAVLGLSHRLHGASLTPVFTKSFGGSLRDYPTAIAVDNRGNIYIAGVTDSRDLPVTANAFQRSYAGTFVAKLDPQGTVVWLTYLGGYTRRF